LRALVTGGAGFIGSHLVDALMESGGRVVVVDNLSSGSVDNLRRWLEHPDFRFVRADVRSLSELREATRDLDFDVVFHLAANPDVRRSAEDPGSAFKDNVVGTFNVLELAREKSVRAVVFTSSSTVYGDPKRIPMDEEHVLEPISVYGATKVAGEALLSAYAHTYGFKGLSLRLANIVGSRCHHGVIYDFIVKLLRNPRELEILGDGTQRKSYLHVSDCVDAILTLTERALSGGAAYDVYNVGNDDWVTVREIADIVVDVMGLSGVRYRFTGGVDGGRGWKGDVKFMLLSIERLRALGWRPRLSSREAVRRAAEELLREVKAAFAQS